MTRKIKLLPWMFPTFLRKILIGAIYMKILKILKKKLVILTIVVVLTNFLMPKPVYAKSFKELKGGKLLDPICDLMVFIRRFCIKCFAKYFLGRPGCHYCSK